MWGAVGAVEPTSQHPMTVKRKFSQLQTKSGVCVTGHFINTTSGFGVGGVGRAENPPRVSVWQNVNICRAGKQVEAKRNTLTSLY